MQQPSAPAPCRARSRNYLPGGPQNGMELLWNVKNGRRRPGSPVKHSRDARLRAESGIHRLVISLALGPELRIA